MAPCVLVFPSCVPCFQFMYSCTCLSVPVHPASSILPHLLSLITLAFLFVIAECDCFASLVCPCRSPFPSLPKLTLVFNQGINWELVLGHHKMHPWIPYPVRCLHQVHKFKCWINMFVRKYLSFIFVTKKLLKISHILWKLLPAPITVLCSIP